MNRKHKFSIRKLSVGVLSVCFGMIVFGTDAEAQEVNKQEIVKNSDISTSATYVTITNQIEKSVDTLETKPVEKTNVTNVNETSGTTLANNMENSSPDSKFVETTEKKDEPKVTNSFFRSVSSSAPATTSTTSDKTPLEALKENQNFQDAERVADYDSSKKEQLTSVLLTNFETKADDVAMSDVVSKKTSLKGSDITKYLIPLLTEFKKKNNLPIAINDMSPEQKALFTDYAPKAQEEALRLANLEITNNDELQSVAKTTKNTFKNLLDSNLLGTKTDLTIESLKTDLPSLLRGTFLLEQQYNFEDGLINKLVFAPHTIKGIAADDLTAYDRLKEYGGRYFSTNKGGLLNQTRDLFNARGIGQFTGFNSIPELVEHLAQQKGMTPEEYYKNRSEAILGEAEGSSIYETIKNSKPELYLPILSQGKGVYAAASKNAFTIGMTETYLDQYTPEQLTKLRGQSQPENPFFLPMLNGFNNYMNFLESVKKKPIPFVTATDSLNHKYDTQKIGVWSKAEGAEAADAVRRFFTPLKMRHPYVKSGVGIGGVSTGASSLAAYETRLMNKDMSGVGLFTHEMTHGNDQAAMYGGTYSVNGRRAGQGPEIYARGLFEAIDNTQNPNSPYIPVFNLNTAIEIKESADRVQARQPLKDKQTMETYMRNLMDLVTYLEAREAEVVFDKLSDDKKKLYFNKVSQIRPTSDASLHITKAGEGKISTNDKFSLFSDNAPSLNSFKDLVNNGAVSGQFIPRGVSPLINEITTNQYDSVPLLESFYAAQSQTAGDKNTVGDISFKRHAYEILGWKGWEAYVDYASDKYSNDADAFRSILGGEANNSWATFKEEQYSRVSKLKPINNLWDENKLKQDLDVAIQKDLAIIENYKRDVADLYKTKSDVTDTDLTAIAVKYNLRSTLTNVRSVKLDILRKALVHNDLMAPVLTNSDYDIIYVSNTGTGDGETATTPMSNLQAALNKVREGGKIVLVDNITERTPVTINKPLTIEGADNSKTLLLNEKLTISKDLTIKGLTLNMIPESTNNGTIEVVGSKLTMENVNTTVSRQDNVRPNVIMTGNNPSLDITGGTTLNQVQTNSSSDIKLNSSNIRINNGIVDNAPNGSVVNVLSKSNYVSSFSGNNESKLNLVLDNNFTNLNLRNVNDLTLVNGARATLNGENSDNIKNKLTINSGTTLTANNNIISVNTLAGGGELILESDSSVTARNTEASVDNMVITFNKANLDYSPYEGKVFVSVINKVGTPTVNLTPINKTLQTNENNQWIYNVERRLIFTFESADVSKQLPETLQTLLPVERVVTKSENITLPKYSQIINDPDGKGEWVFSHWNNADDDRVESITIGDKSITDVYGVWNYRLKSKDPVVEINRVVIPYVVEYEADSNLQAGVREVVRNGVNGEKTFTTTDGVSNEGVVTKNVVNELVKVGTKPAISENIIVPITRYEADSTVEAGKHVVAKEGRPGAIITTTTYTLDPSTGNISSNSTDIRHEPEDRVVKVGTMPKVEKTILESGTVFEEDNTKPYGENIEIAGKQGERVVTTTYTVDENGNVQVNEESVTEIPAVSRVIKLGTQPKVVVEKVPFNTIYEADNTKPFVEGEQPLEKVAGRDGERITTITYTLNKIDGNISQSEKVGTKEATTRILSVNTGSTTRKEIINFSVVEEPTNKLLLGERKIKIPGKNGEKTYNDIYELNTSTGVVTKIIDNDGQITLAPINEVVLVGANVVTKVPGDYPVVELPTSELPKISKVPEDYPVLELPVAEIPEISKVPEDYPVVELPTSELPEISKVPEDYPVVELPTSELQEISKVPEDYPVVELETAEIPEISKVPENYPVVELETAEISEISKVPEDYPVVELETAEISEISKVPEDYPVVELPIAELPKISKVPEYHPVVELPTFELPELLEWNEDKGAVESSLLENEITENIVISKEKTTNNMELSNKNLSERVLPNTGLTNNDNSFAAIGLLGMLGIALTRRKNENTKIK